jgi:acetyl esterase/lipase
MTVMHYQPGRGLLPSFWPLAFGTAGTLLGLLTTCPLLADMIRPPGPARPPGGFAIQESLNISYGQGRDRQKLDVFAPRGLKDCPVVLFVHGGAWFFGDKDFFGLYRGVGQFLAQHGYVAVVINYRLAPRCKHPCQIQDVCQAFAWVRRHIQAHGGAPDQIILCGHSAGGHLVSLMVTDTSYLKDPSLQLTAEDLAAVRGVVGVCGVYRIPHGEEAQGMVAEMVHNLSIQVGGQLFRSVGLTPTLMRNSKDINPFGMVFGDDIDARKAASPLTHVHKGLPPFLLFTAERDIPGLPAMTCDFAAALKKVDTAVEEVEYEGTEHNTILFHLDRPKNPVARALLSFLSAHTTPGVLVKKP